MPVKKTARKAKRKSPVAASGKSQMSPARRRTRLHKTDPPKTPPTSDSVKAASLVSPAGGYDSEAFLVASPHKLICSAAMDRWWRTTLRAYNDEHERARMKRTCN